MTTAPIIIGDDVWIGTGAVITKGVKIGNGAVIGVNSLITKDVPENAVMVGIPAKNVGTATDKFKPYAVEETNSDTTS